MRDVDRKAGILRDIGETQVVQGRITRAGVRLVRASKDNGARGRWFISPHAVHRYITRVDTRLSYEEALEALIERSEASRYQRTVNGVEFWRATGKPRLRFRVAPGKDGMKPVLLTVLWEHDR